MEIISTAITPTQNEHSAYHFQSSAIYAADRAMEVNDYPRAYEFYKQAALKEHHPRALRMLGHFYEHGYEDLNTDFSIPMNRDFAMVHYTEAYRAGDELAREALLTMMAKK